MKIEKLLVGFFIFLCCTTLHLQQQSSFNPYLSDKFTQFWKDNLVQSNLNYYFGNLSPATYNQWSSKNFAGKTCPRENPYAMYQPYGFNQTRFLYCFQCSPLVSPNTDPLFNLETRKCEICSFGKSAICNDYLQKQKKKIEASNNDTSTGISSQNFELCPPQRPLYNPATKLCDICPPNQVFYGPSQSCQEIIFTTNLLAPNVIVPKANSLDQLKRDRQTENPTRLIHECPLEKPYLQGEKCIFCQKQWLFNLTSQQCVQCNEGSNYNPVSFACVPTIFYSDVDASNIVSQTIGFEQWKSQVLESIDLTPRMSKCPKQKPFAVNGKCISCGGDKPLFDIDRGECGACPRGRYYDSEKRYCPSSIDTGSSLKKMIAHIG